MIRLIVPLLFLFACSTAEKSEMKEENNTSLSRIHDIWALQTIDGEKIPEDLSKHPTLEIFLEDKRAMGNDGCNSITGTIKTLTETELVFGLMMGTKMACPNMSFSSDYNKSLSETKFYTIKNLQLVLMDADKNEILRYKKVD